MKLSFLYLIVILLLSSCHNSTEPSDIDYQNNLKSYPTPVKLWKCSFSLGDGRYFGALDYEDLGIDQECEIILVVIIVDAFGESPAQISGTIKDLSSQESWTASANEAPAYLSYEVNKIHISDLLIRLEVETIDRSVVTILAYGVGL